MKLFKNVFLVVLMSLAVVACNKSDDDGGDGGSAANGTLKASISGSGNFESTPMTTTATQNDAGGSTQLFIQGSDNSGRNIILQILGFTGEGTYEISTDNTITVIAGYTETNLSDPANSPTWQAPYAGGGVVGEINVSSVSETNITGTFSFTGKNDDDDSTKNITGGSFNVDF